MTGVEGFKSTTVESRPSGGVGVDREDDGGIEEVEMGSDVSSWDVSSWDGLWELTEIKTRVFFRTGRDSGSSRRGLEDGTL